MTDQPSGALAPADYQRRIRRHADVLLALIRDGPLDARVPACPDWTVRDLVSHLGQVHQWAAGSITDPGSSPGQPRTPPAAAEDLGDWYARSVDSLLETLQRTDPETSCWTFLHGHDGVAAFWSQRQCHELAMHRVDAEQALGRTDAGAGYDAQLAADGIAEVFDVFVHRRQVWGTEPLELAVPVLVECTDRPERWLLTARTGGFAYETVGPTLSDEAAASAGVTLRGTADQLLLLLWRRVALDTVEVSGDVEVARRMLKARLTP